MAKDNEKRGEALFTATDLADAVKSVAKEVAQETAAAMTVALGQRQQAAPAVKEPQVKCPDCQQMLTTGCKGEHVKMVVFPAHYPEFDDAFQGVVINGVRYRSSHENEEVVVPKAAAGAVHRIVHEFEQNERTTRMGRRKQHNSGSIGPHGSNVQGVNPATDGFR